MNSWQEEKEFEVEAIRTDERLVEYKDERWEEYIRILVAV